MNTGFFIAYLGCVSFGMALGAIITILLIQPNQQQYVMTDERRTELIERLWDIMDKYHLSDEERINILHNGDICNPRTLSATNEIAELLLDENLSVDEGAELFDYCYNSLG